MADCKYTCFDRVMHLVKRLPEELLKEAWEIAAEYSFTDFLDFCVKNKCFTEEQAVTLYEGIVMWEDLDGNYWEEDHDKVNTLYDAVGLTREVCNRFVKEEIAKEESER